MKTRWRCSGGHGIDSVVIDGEQECQTCVTQRVIKFDGHGGWFCSRAWWPSWIGTFSGYDTDGYKSGKQKLVISKAKGSSASGTYTYKFQFPAKGKWSKPQPMNLSIFDQEETANGMVDYISGADELGIYTGKYDKADDSLIFSYVSRSQNLLVLTFNLKRKS